jgi:hypothetical protein
MKARSRYPTNHSEQEQQRSGVLYLTLSLSLPDDGHFGCTKSRFTGVTIFIDRLEI